MQQTKKIKMADAISPYLAVSCGLSCGSGLWDCSLFLTGHSKAGIRIRPRALGAWGFIGITGSQGLVCEILGCKDVSLK